jgi:radical SAM-linked protein
VESTAEYVDFDVVNQHANPSTVGEALSRNLPAGFALMELTEISLSEPPVSAKIQQVSYEIRSFGSVSSDEIRDKIRAFNARETFPIEVKRKGKTRSMDLRASVEKLELSDSGVTMVIKSGPSGSINPLDAIAAILGRSREEVRSMNIIKTAVEFGQPSAAVEVAPR